MNIEKNTSIFFTGGTGFFGKALLRHWAALELKGQSVTNVTVLSRNPDKFASQNPSLVGHRWLTLHRGDICDISSLPTGKSFSHVIHAASDSTLGPKLSPLQRYDQIVNGTRNVLDFAIECGANRFLFTSSGAVYGTQKMDIENITENWHGMPDPLDSNNAYGVAKRAAEHLCALYEQNYSLNVVIARCFAFIGPDLPLDVHFAVGNFIRDALWRDEIIVSGDGTPLRSYLYQQDLADWLLTILNKAKSGQAYNVGSDQAISMIQLAHLIRDIVAPNKLVRILNSGNINKKRNIYVPNIQKARNDLKLEVKVSLNEAIRNTINILNEDIENGI